MAARGGVLEGVWLAGSSGGRGALTALVGLAATTLTALSGCGSDVADPAASGGAPGVGGAANGGGGMQQGGTSTGGTAQGGSAQGGTTTGGSAQGGSAQGGSPTGGTSGAPQGGGGSGACSGAFGPAGTVLEIPGNRISGLTLTADELELLYASGPVDSEDTPLYRTTRASKMDPFQPGTPLPEIDAACGSLVGVSGELSPDGLRFYFNCAEAYLASPLFVARRPSIGAPFVVDAMTYGEVGWSPGVSDDELHVFGSPLSSDPVTPPLEHARATTSEAFDAGAAIASLGQQTFYTPDLAPDGRTLYGVTSGQIMQTVRGDGNAFGVPASVLPMEEGALVRGSPAISADCRALYFVEVRSDPASGTNSYAVRVVRR